MGCIPEKAKVLRLAVQFKAKFLTAINCEYNNVLDTN